MPRSATSESVATSSASRTGGRSDCATSASSPRRLVRGGSRSSPRCSHRVTTHPGGGECAPEFRGQRPPNMTPRRRGGVPDFPSWSGWALLVPEGTQFSMGRHSELRRYSVASALGAGATGLTIASLLAIAQTTVGPVPAAHGSPTAAASERSSSPALDFQLVPGPLEIPAIGVVAPGFDAWYASGSGASRLSTASSVSPLVSSVVHSLGPVIGPS